MISSPRCLAGTGGFIGTVPGIFVHAACLVAADQPNAINGSEDLQRQATAFRLRNST
jgi:hypothetical protein